MKIIRLTTLLDFGGQEQQYVSFTEQRELLRHEYIFAAIGHGGNAEKTIRDRGFRVKIFDKNPKITNLFNIWRLYKWFKKEKPDIVHTAAAEANFHGIIAARMAGVKSIFAEEIGLPNHSKKAQKIFKFIYKKIDGVICVSKAVKDWLISLGEISEQKGIVVYNPVSQPAKIKRVDTGIFELVYVGRLEKNKNVSFLLEGFAKLIPNNELHLTIVGDGREREKLESFAKRLKIKEQVTFVGFSKHPEEYVAKAKLFVLPSEAEGFGIAVVEAMYQGVPCFCSQVGGIPEFIEEGVTGWLFDPAELEVFAEKLKRLIELSNHEREAVGTAGQQYVEHRFLPSIYIENIQQVYETRQS